MTQARTPTGSDTQERTRYFPRQILTPPDLAQDNEYLLHRLRRHNRLLHQWGRQIGLEVVPVPIAWKGKDVSEKNSDREKFCKENGLDDDRDLPKGPEQLAGTWHVVRAGYAITPTGDEIYLSKAVLVNTKEEKDGALVIVPCDCSTSLNPRSLTRTGEYLLIVEAVESEICPVRSGGNRCGDHPEQFEYSRIQDGVRFRLIKKEDVPSDLSNPYKGDYAKLTGLVAFDYVPLAKLMFDSNKIPGVTAISPPATTPTPPADLPAVVVASPTPADLPAVVVASPMPADPPAPTPSQTTDSSPQSVDSPPQTTNAPSQPTALTHAVVAPAVPPTPVPNPAPPSKPASREGWLARLSKWLVSVLDDFWKWLK